MFSMSAICNSDRSCPGATSRTAMGTRSRPASFAARQRRSPAMIWNRSPIRRTTMGWMTPLLLIDCASSWSLASSTCPRGWNSFGVRRSISVSTVAVGRGGGRSGINALRPLPSAGRFSMVITSNATRGKIAKNELAMRSLRTLRSWAASADCSRGSFEDFARERAIGFGAARLGVVENHWHAVARRLAESHVTRDDGAEDFLLEKIPDVARDLLSQVRALVEHREQHAVDVEPGVEGRANAAHRADEIGEPLEREVLAVQRNQHRVGGDERVERKQSERR